MHVLHLLKTNTGAAWAFRQIKVLTSLGVEVTVVLPDSHTGFAPEYKKIGVRIIAGEIDFPSKKPLALLARINHLKDIVDEIKPDIIHSHFVGITYLIRLALRSYPIPRIFQIPGPLHLEHKPYAYADILLANQQDYWIGSCEWTCQKYLQLGIKPQRVFKSWYGSYTDTFTGIRTNKLRREYKILENAPLVGLVGYMYPPKYYLGQTVGLKGHEDFIEAIRILKKDIPDLAAVIVGSQPGNSKTYEQKLKKLANRLCGNTIIFTGFRDDVHETYADLDVAVLPSISDNLGGAVETVLSLVPTVSTNIGGLTDLIINNETGYTVNPHRPREIADKVKMMLQDREGAKKMAIHAKELFGEKIDYRTTAREVYDIYHKIIQNISGE